MSMRRYDKSADLLARALRVTPGGSQTLSKQAAKFGKPFPAFLRRGDGARVEDVDGNRFIDWVCGLGAITLGHDYFDMSDELAEQLRSGSLFSLPHPLEVELAERLCAAIPCAEQVRFVKTGSEATEAAIRIARAATGRSVILVPETGYHSWHSWFAASRPKHPGVPREYRDMVRPFSYNNLGEVEDYLEEGGVAAVMMEPTLFTPPDRGFLQGVREICTEHGALLIFDEMVCGYRWALAGGGEYFDVVPDLATFGKGVANGLPLAFVCGSRDLMKHAAYVSGTFGGDVLALRAASYVLDVYQKHDVCGHMWKTGQDFQDGINRSINRANVSAVCEGYPVHPRVRFTTDSKHTNRQLMTVFITECAERGVLLHPSGWNVSYAHGDTEVKESLEAVYGALRVCAQCLAGDREWPPDEALIDDNPFRPVN